MRRLKRERDSRKQVEVKRTGAGGDEQREKEPGHPGGGGKSPPSSREVVVAKKLKGGSSGEVWLLWLWGKRSRVAVWLA